MESTIKIKDKICKIDVFGKNDMCSNVIINKLLWEPKVCGWLSEKINDKTIYFDIGSYLGTHVCVAQLLGAEKIYAYDCNKLVTDKLNNTILLNNWNNVIVNNIGLSNKKDKLKFKIIDWNISASYIVETHNEHYSNPIQVDDINVDQLNSLIDLNIFSLDNNFVVKIDVEGHELNTLEGMSYLLKDIRTTNLIIELAPLLLKDFNTIISVIDLIISYGFIKINIIFDVLKHPWGGPVIDNSGRVSIDRDSLISRLKKPINEGKPSLLEVSFEKE